MNMKRLLLFLGVMLPLWGMSQFTYVTDTIAVDTTTGNPIIGGIVKLNVNERPDSPIYMVKEDGIEVIVAYKVVAVNAGIIFYAIDGVFLSKDEYPAAWNYLTSNTVKTTLNNIMQAYYDEHPVDWSEYITVEQ